MSDSAIGARVPVGAPRPVGVVLTAALAFLLPVAFSTASTAAAWMPKLAVLVAVLPLGILVLVGRWREPVARAGLVFVVVAWVSALLSPAPILSNIGGYAGGTSAALLASIITFWAIGRTIEPDEQPMVLRSLLAAIAINAVLAVLQGAFDLAAYGLPLFDERSAGLLGNPVHLATLAAGGLPLAWWEVRKGRGRTVAVGAPLAALLAAAAQVSGSRILLLALGASSVYLLARHRSLRAVFFVTALGVGIVGGSVAGAAPGRTGASDRISQVGLAEGSTLQRVYTWQEAAATVLDRPLVGYGPGRYLQATLPHRSLRLAEAGPDSYFVDAHNLFVNLAVDVGAIGLLLFLGWLLLSARDADGPALWAAAALVAMHLVQPVHPGTTPLIGLALGVASRRVVVGSGFRLGRPAVAGAVAFGLAVAVIILVGDFRLREARLDADADAAAAAAKALPPWPEVSDAVARLYIFDSIVERDPRLLREAIAWERRAATADERDPRWWMLKGLVEASAGEDAAAERSFRRALELNPYSCGAWNGLRRLHPELPRTQGSKHGRFCE
ncbi:MAG: O-antigen ligase family protein [Actinobacteria bacterium]|nr:O-antigen ligase family protein [Actinomycetota bacterium]